MARRDFTALEQRRLRAARRFAQGRSQAEVARELGVSRQTALRWWTAWRAEGREGLRAAGRAGRRPRMSPAQLAAVEAALLEGAAAFGYRSELWTLPRIAAVIEQRTGVRYHPGHVWRLLRGLGWSKQRPTTRARERDEHAIRRWIRTTWPALKKRPHAAGQRSSSSTRAASPSGRPSAVPGRREGRRRS
jgi:transposase